MNHAPGLPILAFLLAASPALAGVCGDADSRFVTSDRVLRAFECKNTADTLCVVQGYNGLRSARYFRVSGHSRYAGSLLAWIDEPTPDSAANEGESALSLFQLTQPIPRGAGFRAEMIIQKSTGDAVFIVEQNKTGGTSGWQTIIHDAFRCQLSP
jgi:hypothetical protein